MKAVLFDMDGVLLDSYEMWLAAFRFALKKYMGKSISKEDFDKKIWSRSFKLIVADLFKGKEKEMFENYFDIAEGFLDQVKVFPVEETLKKLKEKGLRLAVVSNTYTKTVSAMLRQAKLLKYFDLVLGGDCVEKAKPDPSSLFFCLDKLKVDKSEAVFVGDHRYDMEAGKNAGMFTVGLKVNGGDRRISSLKELLEIL